MAKSRRKHRKNAQPTFYEAMPTVISPPVGIPQFSEQMEDVYSTLREINQAAARRLRPKLLSTLTWLKITGHQAVAYVWRMLLLASLAVYQVFDLARVYAPAVTTDIGVFAGQAHRRLGNRRARAFYLFIAATATFSLVAVAAVTGTATLRAYARDISSPAAILAKKKTGTTILDRNGLVLYQGYGAQDNKLVTLNDIPPSLRDATLAAEDPGFYDHPGISWRGTIRAALTDITHQSRAEGGSTLTQQLVKNALLTSDKDFVRKYKEILLATELEKHYSKNEILQMYLNETYYGQGSSGVQAASATYFHKDAKDLTIGQAALLAGLPLGPSRFDPNNDLQAATGRRNYVLARLQDLGKITPAQAAEAKDQPIALDGTPGMTPGSLIVYPKTIEIKAPHFVFYILDQLRTQYGTNTLEQGGITVRTTLDYSKQQLAEQTVRTRIDALATHHVTNAGLISLEPATGDILAMVGSVDYNAPGFGNVNVTLSDLQPGSSFKPIAYATAFEKGWNGATTVVDSPLSLPGGDGTMYTPQNYDLKFHGTVTLRHALDNSLNIPAVKVLQYAGITDTIKTAHDLGITTLNNPTTYGLSLVLGGGEVRPIDMATVYATFANGGTRVEPRSILKITGRNGEDLTKPDQRKSASVMDPRIAYMITNIISDNAARAPEFPQNSPLKLSRPAAAKTGTTNDFRDNWTVGYTPQIATAVWVGNNDHTPMNNVDGITGAAPIWHDYMEGALASTPITDFTVPPGLTMAKVCSTDGGLANPWDGGYTEVFRSDQMPTKHCATSAPVSPGPSPSPSPATPAPTDGPAPVPNQPNFKPSD